MRLGNDVGETAFVVLGAQRVDLCLLDIVSDERRRPGLANLLDEAAMQRLDQILVR